MSREGDGYMFKLFITIDIFFSSTIAAQDLAPEIKMKACLSDKTNFTTAAMSNCVYQASIDWDSELNIIYQKLMKELNPKANRL